MYHSGARTISAIAGYDKSKKKPRNNRNMRLERQLDEKNGQKTKGSLAMDIVAGSYAPVDLECENREL